MEHVAEDGVLGLRDDLRGRGRPARGPGPGRRGSRAAPAPARAGRHRAAGPPGRARARAGRAAGSPSRPRPSGWCATRTPARSPSRRRQADEEYAVSAARRSTTLCSSRACGVGRGRRAVMAAVTPGPRWAATRVGDPVRRQRHAGHRQPGHHAGGQERRRLRQVGVDAEVGRAGPGPAPRWGRGPSPARRGRATGPSTSRSKPIGLSTRSSSGPSASIGSGSVTSARGAGRRPSCRWPRRSSTTPRWPAWSGQTACRPSSATTRCTGTEAANRSTVSQPPSTARDRISWSAGHSGRGRQRERGGALVEPDRERRRTHALRDPQGAELAAVADDDRDPLVLAGLDLAVRADHDVGLGGLLDEAVERGTGPHQPVRVSCSSSRSVSGRGSSCIHCFVT